jgi:hypothetical protein
MNLLRTQKLALRRGSCQEVMVWLRFNNLPFAYQRSLVVPERHLKT